jgi:hypothetical protein
MNQLSLHILDIAQNSIRANAKLVEINIIEKPQLDEYLIEISDDGHGMSHEQLQQATDPFFTSRTTRKVGLGLPLIKHNAELSGGSFYLESEKNKGMKLRVTFGFSNIDRPVLGDIASSLLILAANEKQTDFVYTHETPNGKYQFDTREVKESLEDVPLSTPEIRKFLTQMIQENLEQIQISE